MSEQPLDLDAIEARLSFYAESGRRVPLSEYIDYDELLALVAEVRELRAKVERATAMLRAAHLLADDGPGAGA